MRVSGVIRSVLKAATPHPIRSVTREANRGNLNWTNPGISNPEIPKIQIGLQAFPATPVQSEFSEFRDLRYPDSSNFNFPRDRIMTDNWVYLSLIGLGTFHGL